MRRYLKRHGREIIYTIMAGIAVSGLGFFVMLKLMEQVSRLWLNTSPM